MTIPNLISLGRLLSVPLIIYLIMNASYGWAFALFLLAGVSDAIDGYIAKALNQTSTLGIYLDPLADKALIVSVYLTLGLRGMIEDFVVILVIFRDVLIVGGLLLLLVLRKHWEVRPVLVSKVNTGVQIFLAGAVLAQSGLSMAMAEIAGRPVGEFAANRILGRDIDPDFQQAFAFKQAEFTQE